jgi:CRP-like cAMP-binding protein
MFTLPNKKLSGEQLNYSTFDPEDLLAAQNTSWDQNILDLRGHFQIKTYSKKSTIYSIGNSLKEIHILRLGRLHLSRPIDFRKPHDAHVLTEILPPGAFFGNKTLREGYVAEETALTAESVEIWSIGAQAFMELITLHPELAVEFFRIQSQRLDRQARYKHWLSTKDVPERLAAVLLELTDLFGETSPTRPEILLKGITQQDLADLIGASRSFVSTLINLMKQDGYLFSIGRNLCIPRDKLAVLAGEDRPAPNPRRANDGQLLGFFDVFEARAKDIVTKTQNG